MLFGPEKFGIFDRITFLIRLKSCITYVDSHYYPKIKIDSDNDLSLEKILTMHIAVILIKFKTNAKQYYHKSFLEKCLYQFAKNNNNKTK